MVALMCASKLNEIRSKLRDQIHAEMNKTLPSKEPENVSKIDSLSDIRKRLQDNIHNEINTTLDKLTTSSENNLNLPQTDSNRPNRSTSTRLATDEHPRLNRTLSEHTETTKVAPRANCKALCIGMNKYSLLNPLENATNDAQDMATSMTHLGYEVTSIFDRASSEVHDYLTRFLSTINPGDDVVLTFAGHGASFNSEPYIFPINASSRHDAVNLYSDFIDNLKRTGAKSAIIIIDACRNQERVNLADDWQPSDHDMALEDWINELMNASNESQKSARGISSNADFGFAILFSTSHDAVASDGTDGVSNGLFTYFFKTEILKPNLSLTEIYENVRTKVRNASDGKQIPAFYDGLPNKYYFYPS
jgi:hypothetical protein